MNEATDVATEAEGFCSKRDDETHCRHWWDSEDEPCCSCGFNGGADAEATEEP